jgi:DNA-binding response OmpR family regulator
MHKILCVEDGPETIMILEATLRGHELVFAKNLKEAQAALSTGTFSLVFMDIELPDGSGLDVMASFADQLGSVPVIFLTSKSDFASKAAAFSLGADDFVMKPFEPKELRLRVDAKLRRVSTESVSKRVLKLASLVCSLDEQRIYKDHGKEQVELTTIEFRIFALLARTPNKIFARAEILERVWGQTIAVTDRAVDVHISNLRKKISGTGVTIEAVIGSGYRVQVRPEATAPRSA